MRISDWSSDVCSSDLVTVALADKLDTLVGFFVIKERPTGSRDPFALRSAALGIIELVLRNGLRLELDYAASRVGHLIGLQQEKSTSTAVHEIWLAEFLGAELFRAFPDFFVDRPKVTKEEAEVRKRWAESREGKE